ncbi:putative cell wall assembly protein, partial [Paenibacillus agaridevorans]
MDGSGDPIIIDQAGKVSICYHDTGEIKLLADSLEELIEEQVVLIDEISGGNMGAFKDGVYVEPLELEKLMLAG